MKNWSVFVLIEPAMAHQRYPLLQILRHKSSVVDAYISKIRPAQIFIVLYFFFLSIFFWLAALKFFLRNLFF